MKTHSILTVAFAFLTSSICSQVESEVRGKTHVGVKGGINYSCIYNSYNDEYTSNSKVGFAGGVFLSIPMGSFGIQTEILFSQKGFTAIGNNVSLTRTTNYIDIPLFLAVKPNELITLLVGPQYSYLLTQNDKFTTSSADTANSELTNEINRRNTLCLISGIDINLSKFVLGARVGWDLFNNNGEKILITSHYKKIWGQVTVGMKL